VNAPTFDTIVAPATPPGRGGVSVIRVSGPKVPPIAKALLGKLPKPRFATYAKFLDANQTPIDEGIALYFPNPHSFTGEDVLELQGHGGVVIVDMLQKRILELGARLARPGEFSERAFLNDKLDLAQAEAIADLIDASSEQAARSAFRSLQGDFSKCVQAIVDKIVYLRTYVEAAIDFVEEEIDFLANPEIETLTKTITQDLSTILTSATQGSLLREGISVVIAGEPNVGKSSLLNALSGKETAIVTSIPGTTRDVLREIILIDGLPLHIIDTAGLRESHDVVEQEGMRRAQKEITKADILIYMVDAAHPHIKQNVIDMVAPGTHVLLIKNKIDLIHEFPSLLTDGKYPAVSISVKDNKGLDLLKAHIKKIVGFQTAEGIFSARRRHIDALQRAEAFVQQGLQQLKIKKAGELLAEELRQAQLALNEITGEFTSDDLLGKIFSSFCIGK
jgi:tRNA modification GTPase